MSKDLKKLILYSLAVVVLSVIYFVYAWITTPTTAERETFLSEIGEGIGTLAMWALVFIYARTMLKLIFGKGVLSRRLLPDYSAPETAPVITRFISFLDRTHVHVGIASVALILLHAALMGLPMTNLFFPLIIALALWQTVFGLFLRWRAAPRNIKKLSYAVHAQLVTGVMMGVFALLGHVLVEQ